MRDSLFAIRNPIRLKNLRARFLPLYAAGVLVLWLHTPDRRLLGLGFVPIALGLVLRGWGAGHLVKNEALSTSGPYAHLRHPLYLGTLLIGSGFLVGLGGAWGLVGLALLWPWFALRYFPRKERVEDARLAVRYGARFDRYQGAVPALWPRLTAWRDGLAETPAIRWSLARYSDNNELGTLLAVLVCAGVFWWRSGLRA